VARDQLNGGPQLYGLLLGAIGAAAVCRALILPRAKAALGEDRMVTVGTVGTAVALALFGLSRDLAVALIAAMFAGLLWIAVLATLNVSAQVSLPAWVRGRGLAMFTTLMFGAMALGSAIWGQVAVVAGVPLAHFAAPRRSSSLSRCSDAGSCRPARDMTCRHQCIGRRHCLHTRWKPTAVQCWSLSNIASDRRTGRLFLPQSPRPSISAAAMAPMPGASTRSSGSGRVRGDDSSRLFARTSASARARHECGPDFEDRTAALPHQRTAEDHTPDRSRTLPSDVKKMIRSAA
jgi:Transmembrane secretion effector